MSRELNNLLDLAEQSYIRMEAELLITACVHDGDLAPFKGRPVDHGDSRAISLHAIVASEGTDVHIAIGIRKSLPRVGGTPLLHLKTVKADSRLSKDIEIRHDATRVAVCDHL